VLLNPVSLIQIYQCLCHLTRLRMLNVLHEGELCVCHFQEILGEPQVKVSKHLAYLRAHGLVESRKEAHWMVYRLPVKPSPELARNLACLRDCAEENPVFRRDSERRRKLEGPFRASGPPGSAPKTGKPAATRRHA
jgi:ArsR family transcriptional regulator